MSWLSLLDSGSWVSILTETFTGDPGVKDYPYFVVDANGLPVVDGNGNFVIVYDYPPTIRVPITVGSHVVGAHTGATGVVVDTELLPSGHTSLIITATTGTFGTESLLINGVLVANITNTPVVSGGLPSIEANLIAQYSASEYYRSLIQPVPGSGPVLGVVCFNDIVYAWRNTVDGLAAAVYKSSPAGWVNIPLLTELAFSAGNAEILPGTTITQLTSGATGVVKKQILEVSTYQSGTASGRLLLSNVTGTFDATHAIQVGGVTKATASSLAKPLVLKPNGHYEFVIHNFGGSNTEPKVYGCDGVNRAFEFDGEIIAPINSGIPDDSPKHIINYKTMLCLSFKGSFQNSGVGEPFQWTATTGANEVVLGEDISGFALLPGDRLGVLTRNSTWQLSGTSILDFKLDVISPVIGAVPYTIQTSNTVYVLDDRGVINISATQSYGNFDNETVSRKIQRIINTNAKRAIASTIYKTRNQIRYYFDNGNGLICTIADGPNGVEYHYTELSYPFVVSCAWSGEQLDGTDIVLLGGQDGYVYQCNSGYNFDGIPVEAYLVPHYTNSKTPTTIKQYRDIFLDIANTNYAVLSIRPDFNFGESFISDHIETLAPLFAPGGRYDTSLWDACYYDAPFNTRPKIHVFGTGYNISPIIYTNSAIYGEYTLNNIMLTYTNRRTIY